jgi:hypothetical protein
MSETPRKNLFGVVVVVVGLFWGESKRSRTRSRSGLNKIFSTDSPWRKLTMDQTDEKETQTEPFNCCLERANKQTNKQQLCLSRYAIESMGGERKRPQ